jgi:cholest-4-en-3-one 26-monooxygenase
VTTPIFDPATLDVASPEHYERNGYPHPEWTWLRKHAPVFWYERENVEPFWVITKHADIVEISKQPTLFLNAPRLAVFTKDLPPPPEGTVRHLLNMDPPDHARHRRLASSWFTPRAMGGMDEKVARVTREVLDGASNVESGDFVAAISARITIAVIAEMLGVPRSDWELLFRWTNEVIAPQDPEFQRDGADARETRRSRAHGDVRVLQRARGAPPEVAQRRHRERRRERQDRRRAARPRRAALVLLPAGRGRQRDDAERDDGRPARVPREPRGMGEAPRESGARRPGRRGDRPWTTPVIQFSRTATRDYTLRGQTIRKDQAVCLFYPSANRDEDVFRIRSSSASIATRTHTSASARASTCAWARISRGSSCGTRSRSSASGSRTASSRGRSSACGRASSAASSTRR